MVMRRAYVDSIVSVGAAFGSGTGEGSSSRTVNPRSDRCVSVTSGEAWMIRANSRALSISASFASFLVTMDDGVRVLGSEATCSAAANAVCSASYAVAWPRSG
jgi:hypothetical protein